MKNTARKRSTSTATGRSRSDAAPEAPGEWRGLPPPGPPLLVILGPTAVGKSDLAVRICGRLAGEIVSVDSMQVYRGLDRGTSKPDAETRARVPHHGIDLADPGQDFSLGEFVRMAEAAIAGIRARGRLPVLVGGTGLYLRGLLKGIVDAPRRDPVVRARLIDHDRRRGPGSLHRVLARVDPETAGRLLPGDRQRIVRALEVWRERREPLSALIRRTPFAADRHATVKIGLTMDRAALYRRIDDRVVGFFAAGLVDEVRGLLAAGVPPGANAFKAIGYREAARHLAGEIRMEEAVMLTQQGTRRYAKRQWTWFRREPGVNWFAVDPRDSGWWAAPLEFAVRAFGGG